MGSMKVLICAALALAGSNAASLHDLTALRPRQEASNSSFPSLSTGSQTFLPSSTTVEAQDTTTQQSISSITSNLSPTTTSLQTISTRIQASQVLASTSSTVTHEVPPTASSTPVKLPIQPHITPALSVGGAVLILTGGAYCLIGIKNQWLQVFLSAAYLASLAVAVLIDYVVSPPVSNSVQGAYFVAIFMTGLIFGAGALIFKDITEGIGCLLGGYSLGMWFLTLKPGGLITNSVGKGVFVGILCAGVWSLSFSKRTRVVGLIGSTSLAGATFVVLGIDCFSRAGYIEFWVYIWGINNNLFPLNTYTFPITKGMQVEIVAIVLGCLIGIMSQIKLWKVVRDRHKRKAEDRLEDERRRDAVEEALGRQLEQQNDRDRAQWEKQYGDRLLSKRQSMLWSQVHPNKRYTNVMIRELDRDQPSGSTSSESLEMKHLDVTRMRPQAGSSNSRQSVLTINVIPESEEEHPSQIDKQRLIAATKLEGTTRSQEDNALREIGNLEDTEMPLSSKKPMVERIDSVLSKSHEEESNDQTYGQSDQGSTGLDPALNVEDTDSKKKKRRSVQSMLSVLSRSDKKALSTSRESLISHSPARSRASSVAATVDSDNEATDLASHDDAGEEHQDTPHDGVSQGPQSMHKLSVARPSDGNINDYPPSPPALVEHFDPEELARTPDATETPMKVLLIPAGDSSFVPSLESMEKVTSKSETLTVDALKSLPSQVSDTVLSFRTNEWAKHIDTPDEPMYEEPESFVEDAEERPVQLVSAPAEQSDAPARPSTKADTRSAARAGAMTPEGPVIAVTAPSPQATRSRAGLNLPSPTRSLEGRTGSVSRNSCSSSEKSSRQSGKRPARHSIQGTVIDENSATNFVSSQAQQRSVSGPQLYARYSQPTPYGSPNGIVPFADAANMHKTAPRNLPRRTTTMLPPMPSRTPIRRLSDPPIRVETRLSNNFNSHQPQNRIIITKSDQRQVSHDNWRMTQLRSTSQESLPQDKVDARRAQMIAEKQQKRLIEQQQGMIKEKKQQMVDQLMRRSGMHDLHQEALRKMQANAYKHI